MQKLKIIWFSLVVFNAILRESFKGNEWNSLIVDFGCVENAQGKTIRNRLVAKKENHGFKLYEETELVLLK